MKDIAIASCITKKSKAARPLAAVLEHNRKVISMLDLLIKNASVLDGTGANVFPADIVVQNGVIQAVGHFSHGQALQIIDAAGRYVTPGFIDIHQHADAACLQPGFGEIQLRQGLTTIVNGNCGLSMAPVFGSNRSAILSYLAPVVGAVGEEMPVARLADYRQAAHAPLHQGMLVGLGTLRAAVAGYGAEPLSEEQLHQLHGLLERSLAEGALGVSLGLGYAPECFFSTEALIRALAPLQGSGVPITAHVRNEGDGLSESVEEMIAVARALKTPVHISHLKAIGRRNWNRQIPMVLAYMEQARQEGLDLSCDVYPYTAGSTQLTHILPPEFLLGGTDAICQRLQDPRQREKLVERLQTGTDFENIVLLAGWENIFAYGLTLPQNLPYEGLSIADAAVLAGRKPLDLVCDLLSSEQCRVTMIDFIAHEEDLARILQDSHSNVISDSTYPANSQWHPRVYGTFTRVLERYVREKQILSLPQAVAKMTAVPAAVLRLPGKGKIAPGYDADLNIFDLNRIHEPATYRTPAQNAQGMDWVLVQGIPAIAEGHWTGKTAGSVI